MSKGKRGKLPTQRTMEYLRKQGVAVDKVERWQMAPHLPGGGVRKDLFGIIDLIAIRNNKIVGIQCSGYSNVAAHITKIEESEFTMPWLNTGALIEVWAFEKKAKGKVHTYTPYVWPITLPEDNPDSGNIEETQDFPTL